MEVRVGDLLTAFRSSAINRAGTNKSRIGGWCIVRWRPWSIGVLGSGLTGLETDAIAFSTHERGSWLNRIDVRMQVTRQRPARRTSNLASVLVYIDRVLRRE